MDNDSTFTLKKKFRVAFPKQSQLLESAKSQDEIDKLHVKFIDEAKENIRKASVPVDQTSPITLTSEQYENLIDATRGQIKNQVHDLIDVLTRLQHLTSNQLGAATAMMVGSGIMCIGGPIVISAFKAAMAGGAVEAEAVAAGVEALTVTSLIAIVSFIIIVVLIPIMFYMQKPANCIVLLINELDDEITFLDDYNVHGKPQLMTTPIAKALHLGDLGTFTTCGLIATSKRDSSLVGTQYGFTMKYGDIRLSFGVENPLTAIYTDNNCFCAINESAKYVAEKTDKHNKQRWSVTKDDITLSIKCNSGSGSTAYYIARVYKTPK